MGGPFTGAAMNPARALGPQLVQDVWSNAWVWYVGPALGACAAALAYEWLYLRPTEPEPVGLVLAGVALTHFDARSVLAVVLAMQTVAIATIVIVAIAERSSLRAAAAIV